jgi:hypothetical protein
MSKPRKTIDVVGVIRFSYRKKPDDLASVVENCVSQWSMNGVYDSEGVRIRNVRVIEVVCRRGIASVVFKARAYRDGKDDVSLGKAAVFCVWEACHSDYYDPVDPEIDGLYLLELEDTELRSPAP